MCEMQQFLTRVTTENPADKVARTRLSAIVPAQTPFHRPRQTDAKRAVESFYSCVRDELLNLNCVLDVFAARAAAEAWLIDYNNSTA